MYINKRIPYQPYSQIKPLKVLKNYGRLPQATNKQNYVYNQMENLHSTYLNKIIINIIIYIHTQSYTHAWFMNILAIWWFKELYYIEPGENIHQGYNN